MSFDELMQMARAFQESRTVLTAIELDLFSAVGEGATAADVASKVSADARATEMLLNVLVALGMLTKEDGVFRNTPVTAQYLGEASPDNARAAMMHTVHLWKTWSTLTECVRTGTSVVYREVGERGTDWVQAFIAAMDRNAKGRAPLVVKAVGTSGVNRMLDIGGGSGAYSIAFARANADLQAEVLDLPPVLTIAQGHIEEAGLSGRITTRPGDLRTDEFGAGYDLVLLSAICHMLGPKENLDIFRRCFRALAPAGRIVIQDFILEPDRTAPRFAALFALNMLVGTKNGSSYSGMEYTAWLEEAGFRKVRHVPLAGPSGLMVAARQ
jgi:2-polyprenyl-3-methyl-5-hydroxy-6-metoxy-1,4-benzoquinol methylase